MNIDMYMVRWRHAVKALDPELYRVATLCGAFTRRLCSSWETVLALTQALVLYERLFRKQSEGPPTADAFRGCVVIALQMTVDEELGLDPAFARGLCVTTTIHEVQKTVLQLLEHRILVSEQEFFVYRDAVTSIVLPSTLPTLWPVHQTVGST